MGKMGAEKRMQGNLEKRELVLLIEAAKRQGKTRQVDLRIEFTIDERVNLQNDEIMQKQFKELH